MDVNKNEQTLVLIKPDALKNSLTGYVLSQLSETHTGLLFAASKIVNVSSMLAREHYIEHDGKVFFSYLIRYLSGVVHYPDDPWKRRTIAIVYHGPDAIKKVREIAGPTHPHDARDQKPGCIRSLGTIAPLTDDTGKVVGQRIDNLIHGSANEVDAEREIKLWFKPSDIPPLMRMYPTVVASKHFYYKENRVIDTYEPGSLGIVVPGDIVWESDWQGLNEHHRGESASISMESLVAKYIIYLYP